MSCRVLARGVEQYMMNEVVSITRNRNRSRVVGEYIPAAKNGMVRAFFHQFGFSETARQEGHTWWALDVARYEARRTHIQRDVGVGAIA
jgi:predicted enzyme involved in methoxymalonyl-ACP biosynthesis